MHPGSGQWTQTGSHYPGLGQVDVDGPILLGEKMLIAVREAADRLLCNPALGVVFRQ